MLADCHDFWSECSSQAGPSAQKTFSPDAEIETPPPDLRTSGPPDLRTSGRHSGSATRSLDDVRYVVHLEPLQAGVIPQATVTVIQFFELLPPLLSGLLSLSVPSLNNYFKRGPRP